MWRSSILSKLVGYLRKFGEEKSLYIDVSLATHKYPLCCGDYLVILEFLKVQHSNHSKSPTSKNNPSHFQCSISIVVREYQFPAGDDGVTGATH